MVADTCIGGVAEAAQTAEKFARAGVGVSLTVTPCWCYGSETMDMDPLIPKAVWGFNGTERPGAVYLAAVLAAHNQKGLPAFSIYGHDVQDAGDTHIPEDVAGEAAALCPGRAGGRDHARQVLPVDGWGLDGHRRIDRRPGFLRTIPGHAGGSGRHERVHPPDRGGHLRPEEFERAMPGHGHTAGKAANTIRPSSSAPGPKRTGIGRSCVKMTLIARDLMVGNPRLAEMGFGEEALGHNAMAAGFQGQRQWTDHFPNGDFMEAMLNSSFDWNGIRAALHLCHRKRQPERGRRCSLATC